MTCERALAYLQVVKLRLHRNRYFQYLVNTAGELPGGQQPCGELRTFPPEPGFASASWAALPQRTRPSPRRPPERSEGLSRPASVGVLGAVPRHRLRARPVYRRRTPRATDFCFPLALRKISRKMCFSLIHTFLHFNPHSSALKCNQGPQPSSKFALRKGFLSGSWTDPQTSLCGTEAERNVLSRAHENRARPRAPPAARLPGRGSFLLT